MVGLLMDLLPLYLYNPYETYSVTLRKDNHIYSNICSRHSGGHSKYDFVLECKMNRGELIPISNVAILI